MLKIEKSSKYIKKEELEKVTEVIFEYLNESFDIGVKFACENCIRGLNKEYRGKDEPTNVLSFNTDEDSKNGDIVICESVVEKEANELNYDAADLVILYFIHGILHLAGFDHIKDADRDKMEDTEQLILSKLRVDICR